MRIELSRGLNQEYEVPKDYFAYKYVRIMKIDLNGNTLDRSKYTVMGPRKVRINIPIDKNVRVFGTILDTQRGNRLFS